MASTVRSARRTPPAVCCRMVSRPVCPCEILPFGQAGELEINGDRYAIEYNAELPAEGEPLVYGFRVTKAADLESCYDLPADLSSCECLGFFRYGYCRHQTGLRQVLDVARPAAAKLTDRFAAETI